MSQYFGRFWVETIYKYRPEARKFVERERERERESASKKSARDLGQGDLI
jgi:hypothetical protein